MEKLKSFWKSRFGKLAVVGVGAIILVCCILVFAFSGEPAEPQLSDAEIQQTALANALTQISASQPAVVEAQSEEVEQPPAATQPLPPTDIPTSAPTADPNQILPGTYLVGSNIQPGLYMGQAGQDFGSSCYWQRLSGLSGTLDEILANDNSVGKYYIEVRAGDYALQTDCLLVYLPVAPPPTNPFPQTILAGMYLVNIDIQPGTYQGQAGVDFVDSCYWARLSNVAGDLDGILANDNAIGQYYVQVLPSDYALSIGCDLVLVQ